MNYFTFLWILWVISGLWVIADVWIREKNIIKKLIWSIFAVFLGFFTALVYFIVKLIKK